MTNVLRLTEHPPLRRDQALERLRDAIITGHFAPGARLIERELCEAMGVSRTSIREVLRRLEAEQLIRLSKGWRSPIKFVCYFVTVKSTDLLPSTTKEAPPNLSSLMVANSAFSQSSWRLFVQWSFSENLETLNLITGPELMLNALFEEHISTLPKVSFPRLKSLHLSILPGRENQRVFFDCMPMLENLDLVREYTARRQPLDISETAIPRLRRYEGQVINLLALVPRRPIYHLRLSGLDMLPTLWGSHAPPVLNFGSTSAMRYLYLSQTADPLHSLQLIALVCPSLYELELTLYTSHLSAVSPQLWPFIG